MIIHRENLQGKNDLYTYIYRYVLTGYNTLQSNYILCYVPSRQAVLAINTPRYLIGRLDTDGITAFLIRLSMGNISHTQRISFDVLWSQSPYIPGGHYCYTYYKEMLKHPRRITERRCDTVSLPFFHSSLLSLHLFRRSLVCRSFLMYVYTQIWYIN